MRNAWSVPCGRGGGTKGPTTRCILRNMQRPSQHTQTDSHSPVMPPHKDGFSSPPTQPTNVGRVKRPKPPHCRQRIDVASAPQHLRRKAKAIVAPLVEDIKSRRAAATAKTTPVARKEAQAAVKQVGPQLLSEAPPRRFLNENQSPHSHHALALSIGTRCNCRPASCSHQDCPHNRHSIS